MNVHDPDTAPPAGWQQLLATRLLGRFSLLCLGVWLHAADMLVTATLTPSIVDDIGGVPLVSWMISLYQVGSIISGAASAVTVSRQGLKHTLLLSALLYGAGCVAAAAAPTMPVLLAARFVQGIGGGLLLSLCYLAIQQWFDSRYWSRLFGINAFVWGAGSLLGPLIGGEFARLHAWRIAFWSFALQAAVLCILTLRYLPADAPGTGSRAQAPAQRWPIVPLLLLLLATLVIAESGVSGQAVPGILGCAAGGTLLYIAARLDQRAPERLLPSGLLEVREPLGAGLLMIFALSVGTCGFWAYGPLILNILFGVTPLFSGYALAVEALAWSLATMAVSSAPASAERLLIRGGAVAVAIGAGGFAGVLPVGSLPGIFLCSILQGVGFGLFWPAVVQRLVRCADAGEHAVAAASPSTVQRIGYAVGTAISGIAANLCGLAAGASAEAARLAAVWVFAAFFPVLGVALYGAWRFTATSREPATPPQPE